MPTPFEDLKLHPASVRIPWKQHAGEAAQPKVRTGQTVRKGDLLGDVPEGKLGAAIHASIDGVIGSITEEFVEITAADGQQGGTGPERGTTA